MLYSYERAKKPSHHILSFSNMGKRDRERRRESESYNWKIFNPTLIIAPPEPQILCKAEIEDSWKTLYLRSISTHSEKKTVLELGPKKYHFGANPKSSPISWKVLVCIIAYYLTSTFSLVTFWNVFPEVEFLDEIQTKVLRVFLFAFTVTSTALPWDFYFFKLTQTLTVSTSVLYGIISERRSVLAAQLLLREKSGA